MDFLNDLLDEIFEDLRAELKEDAEGGDYSEVLLRSKIKNAAREVLARRMYPSAYTDDMKLSDMEGFYTNIRNLALYDYNMIGTEGETTHSEKNISRSYVDRSKYFYGVLPIARLV